MGKKSLLLLPLFLAFCAVAVVAIADGYVNQQEGGEMGPQGQGGGEFPGGNSEFLLKESMEVVRTDAGGMRVIRGGGGGEIFWRRPMYLGVINMEPNSLFIPQYLDSNLILFIRRGEARIGHIYKDDFVERTLNTGDVYRIESGSAFYIVNSAEGQRLHVICSIDTSDNYYGWQWNRQGFQSYFVAGGTNPTSVLSGFEPSTLVTAMNISDTELREILTTQHLGSIVFFNVSHAPSMWSKFLDLEKHQKLAHMKRIVQLEEKMKEEEEQPSWSIRKLFLSILGGGENRKSGGDKRGKGPEAYNIYNRKADFSNDYGWSKAVTYKDYSPLGYSDIGIYIVNLTAGSMMAPHINPRATEYGVVLSGCGNIQIVFPNGTLAMNARVCEGDAFWIPRFFPFCQIASRSGAFEFFGFTTSARNNRPQMLVGGNSLMQNLVGPEFAAAFGISEERLRRIANAQNESTILPSAAVSPPDEKPFKVADAIKSFGNEMMMGFD